MNTYFKFIVVRDPLQRLVSGYKNKFEEIGRDILFDMYKGYVYKANGITNIKGDRNISFSDFTNYITTVYKETLKFLKNSTTDGADMDLLDKMSHIYQLMVARNEAQHLDKVA